MATECAREAAVSYSSYVGANLIYASHTVYDDFVFDVRAHPYSSISYSFVECPMSDV